MKISRGITGTIFILIGLLLLFLPGPGLLFIFVGLMLMMSARIPLISKLITKFIAWTGRKTNWKIGEKIKKMNDWTEDLWLRIKNRKR